MPIRRFLEKQSFGPESIKNMNEALESALARLQLTDRDDPVAVEIARRIITFAQQGEQNPSKLCELALTSIRE